MYKFMKRNLGSGQHSKGTEALLPSEVRDFAMLPDQSFGGKQFHCYMSCDLEVNNKRARCWEKNPAI